MQRLNKERVEQTQVQLKRLQGGYISAIVLSGLLLIPLVNMILSMMMLIPLLVGILMYVYYEQRKHYKDRYLLWSIGLALCAFCVNIGQMKYVYMLKEQMNFLGFSLIGLIGYVCIAGALGLLITSFVMFQREFKAFQAMVDGRGYSPFRIQPAVLNRPAIHEVRTQNKQQLISFLIRAIAVIIIYFVVMNNTLVATIVIAPFKVIIYMFKSGMDGEAFSLFARAWMNVYLQTVFAIVFISLFYREIRFGLRKMTWQLVAYIFIGYALSMCSERLVMLLLQAFHLTIPQSENQSSLMEMQKIAPVALILAAALLAPITEELVFREGIAEGVYRLLTSVFQKSNQWVKDLAVIIAIFISGSLFGFIHVMGHGDYIAVIPYLVSGLIYTFFYFMSGRNVAVTIGIHMMNNTIATIVTL